MSDVHNDRVEPAPGAVGPALATIAGLARQSGRRVLDLVVPPSCAACRAPVTDQAGLCARCWGELGLIERPYCDRLGVPFAYDLGPGALSAEAIAHPPAFDRSRAVAVYNETAGRLVRALKYRDRQDVAQVMGRMMARAGSELVGDADLLLPVPLHRTRLLMRRFNQSAILAAIISRECGVPISLDSMVRVRATKHQVGLSAADRETNVRGAFRVRPEAQAEIAGRKIVVIDDVLTSGATATAAVRTLKRAGAARVDVLVFARVAGQQGEPI